MKFPKLKNTFLCQFIMYFPAVLFFALIILLTTPLFENVNSAVRVILFIAANIAELLYIFVTGGLFLHSELLFSDIKAWKNDRKNYYTDCNGADRKTAQENIQRRLKSCGKKCEPVKCGNVAPSEMRYRRSYSWTVFWAAIERVCLLYSVDFLDADKYREIITSAQVNAKTVKCKKSDLHFLDKNKKSAEISTAIAVIILADRVSYDIPKTVRNNNGEETLYEKSCVLACVADFAGHRYITDGMKEPYIAGMVGYPTKNRAIDLLKKAVFAGRLPLKGNNEFSEYDFDGLDINMSLWEYISKTKKEINEEGKAERELVEKMRDGEVKATDDFLYCKIGERTAAFRKYADENDEDQVHVDISFNYWCFPKKNKISKKDMETVKQKISLYFSEKGQRVDFES